MNATHIAIAIVAAGVMLGIAGVRSVDRGPWDDVVAFVGGAVFLIGLVFYPIEWLIERRRSSSGKLGKF